MLNLQKIGILFTSPPPRFFIRKLTSQDFWEGGSPPKQMYVNERRQTRKGGGTGGWGYFFIKQINTPFLLCEICWKLDILNTYLSVKYSMAEEKHGDFVKKKNMRQVPKPWWTFPSKVRQVTFQNNLEPIYTWFKTRFQLEIRENGLLPKLWSKFAYIFSQEK